MYELLFFDNQSWIINEWISKMNNTMYPEINQFFLSVSVLCVPLYYYYYY